MLEIIYKHQRPNVKGRVAVLKTAPHVIAYHTILAANWIFRGLLACELITPKAELVGLSCGALKVTRLVILKNSNRSCM